jgi:predicted nucleic acid-binding protein
MKLKVYLDTSVISARFDSRNPERQSLTADFFDQVSHFEVYISEMTLVEIEKTTDEKLREQMNALVQPFTVLKSNDEIQKVAEKLIQYGAVPQNSTEDAYHIALSVVWGMDYLLSWNFRHIVRLKTRDVVRMVTTLEEYRSITIMTPAELF